jgi:predicted choloylglycine hydrolase
MKSFTNRIACIDENYPGDKWVNYYQNVKDGYLDWFLKEGSVKRPKLSECRTALEKYMPEFVPLWEHLTSITKASDDEARMLSMYCPSTYKRGCSQAAWTRYSPVLVRNYDYSPELFEGRIQKNNWNKTQVISVSDCLWGALDGINEHGLCISLSYGGSDIIGVGFGVSLVTRYALDFCKTTNEAIEVFKKIPINMAYNITLMDSFNHVVTIEVSPVEDIKISAKPFAVNQQGGFDLNSYGLFSNSEERQQTIKELLFDPLISIESFISAFSYSPLFSTDYDKGFGTLYTAIYNPLLRACEYRLPGEVIIYQSFGHFVEHEVYVNY